MSADKQQQNIFVADYLLGKIHVFDAALGYVGAWYGIFGVISPTAFNLLLSLMLAVGSRDDIGMLGSGLEPRLVVIGLILRGTYRAASVLLVMLMR